jgi:G3E family GTPase
MENRSGQKAEVILFSGFLGAGKTTLLKRVLSWEKNLSDTVVLVNEFGDVGIDGSLLQDSGSNVIELTSGCICCTLSNDLIQSLEEIWRRFSPKRILIESSGLADPTSIISVLEETVLYEKMEIKKIVTVLDADFWEAREVFGPLFYNQLSAAHLVLLNKVDLLEKDQIPLFLKEIHESVPNSQIVPTIRCKVDPETLWMEASPRTVFGLKPIHFFHEMKMDADGKIFDPNEQDHGENISEAHGRPTVDASNYTTFSFHETRPLDEIGFHRFVSELPWELFRMKGPVCFQDRTVMINFVGGKAEWFQWEGESETRLAFIGWNINSDDTLNKLQDCVAQ